MKHFTAQILIDLQEQAATIDTKLPKFLEDIITPEAFDDEEYKIGFVSAVMYVFQTFTEMNDAGIFTTDRFSYLMNNLTLRTSQTIDSNYLAHLLAAESDPSIEDGIYLDPEFASSL